ncbi:MAG: hypothetical protein ACJAV3_000395 [Alcanivorax sp.]|jgi:hypothetical protein
MGFLTEFRPAPQNLLHGAFGWRQRTQGHYFAAMTGMFTPSGILDSTGPGSATKLLFYNAFHFHKGQPSMRMD